MKSCSRWWQVAASTITEAVTYDPRGNLSRDDNVVAIEDEVEWQKLAPSPFRIRPRSGSFAEWISPRLALAANTPGR